MIMVRTPVFKCLQICAVTLLVLALTLGSAGAQSAQAANAAQVSAGWMPFSGSLYDSQTNSHISVNGLVHILTRWKSVSSSQWQVDIDVNLPTAGVTVTTDTGIPYIAASAGQSSVFIPTDPLFPTDPMRVLVPSFLMVVGSDRALPPNPVLPPNPIKPFGIGLQFDLVFSAVGVLDFNASTVQVVQFTEGPGLGDG
jgi:hypothetical protein